MTTMATMATMTDNVLVQYCITCTILYNMPHGCPTPGPGPARLPRACSGTHQSSHHSALELEPPGPGGLWPPARRQAHGGRAVGPAQAGAGTVAPLAGEV